MGIDGPSVFGQIAGRPVRVTASVGIAIHDPQRPSSIEELLEAADLALYEAKRGGRNRAFLADRTSTVPRTVGV